MFPRDLLFASSPPDALLETSFIIAIGFIVNLSFYIHRGDIARRKRSEEFLSRTADGSPIAAFIINKQHEVVHWNTALESLSGIKKKDIVGTCDQWRAFYTNKRPVMADLIIDSAPEETIEDFYRDKSNKSNLITGAYEAEDFFPALGEKGKWLLFTASPIRDESGEIVNVIETLQDVTEKKKLNENLHYYLQEITRAQEDERKRISRELHDSTTQNLIALLRQLENFVNKNEKELSPEQANALWSYYEQIKFILKELRRFSRDLRPSVLDELGLIAALEWVTAGLSAEYGMDIKLNVSGNKERLSKETELLLFRVVQEALRNVAKHAHTTKAEVIVEFKKGSISLTISDKGKGFKLNDHLSNLPETGKLGLVGMQERIQLLGGSLNIVSEPGIGTDVFIKIPV